VPTRFDVERAAESSGLPHKSRHLLLALCARMSAGTTAIPPEHSPSLQKLHRVTGISLRSVKRHLNRLEREGWLIRDRPTLQAQRAEHAVTRYTVILPAAAVPAGPVALADPLDALVIGELEKRTGTRITPEWASKVRAELLGRPGIRDPHAWIVKIIRDETNPGRWLPGPDLPNWRDRDQWLPRPEELYKWLPSKRESTPRGRRAPATTGAAGRAGSRSARARPRREPASSTRIWATTGMQCGR